MEGSTLKEELFNTKKTGWNNLSKEENKKIFQYSNEYMYFLDNSKTEKAAVKISKDILVKNGFKDISEYKELKTGDKVFYINRDRSIYVAVIGEDLIEDGMKMLAAHIDSPRLDLKQNPLYEDNEFALFKTQYYGGIKKYQWTNVPLSMHGLIVKSNGEKVEIVIGEDDKDPVFTISDLLPHLAVDQMERKLREGIKGEELNILVGSIPYEDENVTERVKLNILKLLNDKYGITEIDFTSSEIEFVPAFKARSLGFDSSMVASYGQDDKSCSYASLRAILNIEKPKKTAVCILIDREEVGFIGNTGMHSRIFEVFVNELLDKTNQNRVGIIDKAFSNTKVLSADVEAAFDPTFSSEFERNNCAYMGKGVTITKFGGSRGKSGASEASAEFIAEVRNIFEKANVKYQSCQLNKVDKGGGGTIAVVLANRGMDVVDCGLAVLGMHSPFEITSKYDLYNLYKGYEAFYK